MKLQCVVVPVVVATFVAVPYFPMDAFGVAFYEFVGFVRESSMFVFAVGLAITLSTSSRVADASIFFSAGATTVILSLCSLAGFFTARTLGSAVNAVAALLFVAYLVAAIVLLSVGKGREQKARNIERSLFDAYLRQRCAEIASIKGLSPRESEILVYLGRGHGYVYIAELAYISESTVRAHAKSIFRKCGVSSREELLDFIDQPDSTHNR